VAPESDPPARRGTPLSEADTERFAEILSRHVATDSLTVDELEQRLEVLYNCTTREQAARVIADLPPIAAEPEPGPARRRWRRGHGESRTAGVGWLSTDERFRDPGTDRIMRVWVDPADGSRHYVPDSD
jgi:hypothetical protein